MCEMCHTARNTQDQRARRAGPSTHMVHHIAAPLALTSANLLTDEVRRDNAERLQEELDALHAIYDTDGDDMSEASFTVRVRSTTSTHGLTLNPLWAASGEPHRVHVDITVPENYPTNEAPTVSITANWLHLSHNSPPHEGACKHTHSLEGEHGLRGVPWTTAEIQFELTRIFESASGEVVLFEWLQWILAHVQPPEQPDGTDDDAEDTVCDQDQVVPTHILPCPAITASECLTDRKSIFQGRAAPVTSLAEVKVVLAKLYSNRKIARATHNIYAYRIRRGQYFDQDNEDDGETAAGSRLAHLLTLMDAQNVLVVVTRWYGGVLLGSDRFKHINNVARVVLEPFSKRGNAQTTKGKRE